MATLADSLVSSTARVLPMRMHPTCKPSNSAYQGQLYWVVKEPVGLHYFRFQEEEFAILKMLDGHSSLDQIKHRFERNFPPQKITVEELGQFIGTLHRSGLVIADVPGQGRQLKKRRDERRRKEMLGMLSNILALRFKGIDPERLLNWLYPKVRFMYSRAAVFVCMAMALSALTLVAVQFDQFRSRLPTFHQFFQAQNWIWLGLALAVTKVIHEFGHGLTCKHFGGECHEMGVMFLVLTPCLYCNVSDSWMLPNKWHRAWIGAGGMYIELVIASICTFIWWFSRPETTLNQVCLSTMFVCSVSTVMFNANPLLRYDGYYILADLVEIPNLRQKASTILSRKLGTWCLGLEEPDDPFLPQRNQGFFVLYSIAAAIYRWVVLFSILWFLYKVFEPYGLKVLSQMLAMVSIGGLVVAPLWKVGKFFYLPGRLEQVKRSRLQATLGIFAALVLFIAFVPLPYRVLCTLEVKPRDATSVYISVPGRLEQIDVKPGQHVNEKQPLAQLENLDVDLAIAELTGQMEGFKERLKGLNFARFGDKDAAREIPEVQESLDSINKQLKEKEDERQRLTLKAPVSGTVLPPPAVPVRDDPDQLPSWTGTPLEHKNLNARLAANTLFCQIGDPKCMEAILVIEQDDIPFIGKDQPVEIKLDHLPGRTFKSQIVEIGPAMKFTPRQLSNKAGGEVVTKTDESGRERPITTSFQARAPLDDADGLLSNGLRGRAKIHAQWQSLGERFWRYLVRTFNFKL